METQMVWNSSKQGGLFRRNDSNMRTLSLINEMEKLKSSGDFYAIKFGEDNTNQLFNLTNCGGLDNALSSESFEKVFKYAIEILKKNPNMLEYTFKKEGQLKDIIVHNAFDYIKQFKQNDSTLCDKACAVHAALEMFMHLQAVDHRGSTVPYKPPTILMTGNLSEKCRLGIGYNGGSKSPRKRRNRTRHGRKHNARPTKRRRS